MTRLLGGRPYQPNRLAAVEAGPRGHVVHAVRTFRHVMAPIPAHGWYLNIHQGSSATIISIYVEYDL